MNKPALPISVFIIAKNEADRIGAAIRSVAPIASEVLVIDSGSSDATVEVAASLGARVLQHPFQGYGPQKVFGESQCRYDWVLNLDADEALSPELAEEIAALFAAGTPPHTAYTLPILPIYPTQERGHPWTAFHHPVRLYDRRHAGFKNHPVHDSVVVHRGTVGHLRGFVLHRSFRSLTHHVAKVNETSTLRAEDYLMRKGKPSAWMLFLIPFFAFWKSYLLRREWVNGPTGIVISHMYAFTRFLRLAKAWELSVQRDRGKSPSLAEPGARSDVACDEPR